MYEPGNRDWRGSGSGSGYDNSSQSKAKYLVFVMDINNPLGGWADVLEEAGKVQYFSDDKLAAKAAKEYGKAVYPKSWKYQIVEITTGKLMGTGGYDTGRNHQNTKTKNKREAK